MLVLWVLPRKGGRRGEMKIAIISDTHDLLRPEVAERLGGCGLILHGGDISSPGILSRLEEIAPVRAVRGNNDGAWAEDLPVCLSLEAGGLRICMAHKKKDLPRDLSGYDLAVYGHSHQYACAWLNGPGGQRTLLLNPGSCGPRRFRQAVTMAVLLIGEGSWQAKRIDLSPIPAQAAPGADPGNMRRLVGIVIRETQKGQSPGAIARKYGMEEALAEQIARLYVTHPGVTEDGILTKMGL